MKRRTLLLGIAAFVLALLVVLPASWVGGLLPSSAQCGQWRGSVWRGHCAQLKVTVPGQPPLTVESAQWTLHPLQLLRGRLAAEVTVTDARGDATGHVELGRAGLLVLREVSAHALLDPQFPAGLPRDWRGRLEMASVKLDWQANQLRHLQGEFSFLDLRDERGQDIGSYHLSFPPAAAAPFHGQINDLGGPLELHGTLALTSDRSWTLNGKVLVRGTDTVGFSRYLEALGAPDASGRYTLSVAGTFK